MISRKVFFFSVIFFSERSCPGWTHTGGSVSVGRLPEARLLPLWKHTSIVVSHSDSPNWMMDAESSPKGRLNFSL